MVGGYIVLHTTKEDTMEKIACVALRSGSIIISLPRPNRHGDIIKHMVCELGYPNTHGWNQGFLTNTHRYVDRIEGAAIAQRSGQIEKLNWPPRLFSEDLW